jgi:predicted transcriptional regulator
MASVKEDATNTIARLSDDATWDDVLYAMYVRHGIAAGEADITAGRIYSTEEVLRSLGLPVK